MKHTMSWMDSWVMCSQYAVNKIVTYPGCWSVYPGHRTKLLWSYHVASWSAQYEHVILFAYILFREITIHCFCKCYNNLRYTFLFTICFYPALGYREHEFTWRVDNLFFLAFMNKLFMPLYVLQ